MSPISFRRKTIRGDKTVGQLLAEARERLAYSLEVVESATRIRHKYLEALEDSRFDQLPEEVYALGFLRRYALFLRLQPAAVISQFRAERLAAEKLGMATVALDQQMPALSNLRPVLEPKFIFTPKFVWVAATLLLVVSVAGYLWYQIDGFLAAPALDLASQTEQLSVAVSSIAIAGRTTGTATVTINAEPVTLDRDGNFHQEVHLEPGLNTIEVAAKNRLNRETKKQLRVMATYPPGQGAVSTTDQQS